MGLTSVCSVSFFLVSLALQGDEVAASAETAKPLTVGTQAPDAMLRTMDRKTTSLKRVLHGRPTVLIFYRGSWCPFCNVHLSDLVHIEPQLKTLGFQTIAISPDRPEELVNMSDKNHLNYKLYSDSSAEALRKFGVAFRVDDATLDKYHHYGVDLDKASGENHHILPVPSVFIIDKSGTIRFVHSNPDYKVRLKGEEVLAAAMGVARG